MCLKIYQNSYSSRNCRISAGWELISSDKGNAVENVTWKYLYYFAIISTRSAFDRNGELPRNQIGSSGVQYKKENEEFTVVSSRSPHNFEFGHFTLLFCSWRQRNVQKM